MPVSLLTFLRTSKEKLSSEDPQSTKNWHVVLGNQACDLDSAVCCICYAYHLQQKASEADVVFLPVLNIKQQEYHLKTEVTHVLNKVAISQNSLTFLDQIDLPSWSRQHKLQITLVDHNVMEDEDLDSHVVNIIDHHACLRNDLVPRLIEKVGSCATLVVESILKDGGGYLCSDAVIAGLLYAAIIMDTSCLKNPSKTTQKDIQVVSKLEKAFTKLDREGLFQEMTAAKNDISSFSIVDLLMKDMKVIHFKPKSSSIAVSSTSLHPLKFFIKDTPQNVLSSLSSVANKHHILVVMFISSLHVIERHVACFSHHPALLNQTCDILVKHNEPSLQMEKFEFKNNSQTKDQDFVTNIVKNPKLQLFHQKNVDASRKVVLPILQQNLSLIFKFPK